MPEQALLGANGGLNAQLLRKKITVPGGRAPDVQEILRSEEERIEEEVRKIMKDVRPVQSFLQSDEAEQDHTQDEEKEPHFWDDPDAEKKVILRLMTDAEHQDWLHTAGHHQALSPKEAQHVVDRHFQDGRHTSKESASAALMELERRTSGQKERNAFWRKQRAKLDGQDLTNESSSDVQELTVTDASLLTWKAPRPKISAYACVQVNINLAFMYLPFLYLNLGLMGVLAFDTDNLCWSWTLEVGVGISGGFSVGLGLKLNFGISLTGSWTLAEIPFGGTGLKASDYTLPDRCEATRSSFMAAEKKDTCHTRNPFKLLWIGIKGLFTRVKNKLFPVKKAKSLMKSLVAAFNKQKYIDAQMERYQGYKRIFQPLPENYKPQGSQVLQVECLNYVDIKPDDPELRGVAKKEAWFATWKSLKKHNPVRIDGSKPSGLTCNFDVGNFEMFPKQISQAVSLRGYKRSYESELGVQLRESEAVATGTGTPGIRVTFGRQQFALMNVLVDDHRNSQLRVWAQAAGSSSAVADGLIDASEAVKKTASGRKFTMKVGCRYGIPPTEREACTGRVEMKVTPLVRRGRLSVQVVRGENFQSMDTFSESDPYVAMKLSDGAVLGENPWWRSNYVQDSNSPVWDQGAAWSIFAKSGAQWPSNDVSGNALRIFVYDDEGKTQGAIKDYFVRRDGHSPKRWSTDQFMGEVHLTWEELLGEEGLRDDYKDGSARLIVKELPPEQGPGSVTLRVNWQGQHAKARTDEPHQVFALASKFGALRKDEHDIHNGKLVWRRQGVVWAASGLHTAASQFLGKLPKYSEQVLERLVDDVETDSDTSNTDCAKALRASDGSGGARLHRMADVDSGDGKVMYHKDYEPTDWSVDDRVMNLAKVGRVSINRGNVSFWREVGYSTANLFVRIVGDIQAMFGIYFADEAEWDGQCNSLKPGFELPYETTNGKKKRTNPMYRYMGTSPELLRQHPETANIYAKGDPITKADKDEKDAEQAFYRYNPASDFKWAYGHGFEPKKPRATAKARMKFWTPDSPNRKSLKDYSFEGDTSPTVTTHLWCDLATLYAKWQKDTYSKKEEGNWFVKLTKELAKEGIGLRIKQQNFRALVMRALLAFDADGDGRLDPEEMRLQFEETCVDSHDCGDRVECEKVHLKEHVLVMFPRLATMIKRYYTWIKRRLVRLQDETDLKKARAAAWEVITLVRYWLAGLGACNTEAAVSDLLEEHLREDKKALERRAAMCRLFTDSHRQSSRAILASAGVARAGDPNREALVAVLEDLMPEEHRADLLFNANQGSGTLTHNPDDPMILSYMTEDFHQAFGMRTELPLRLQNSALAQQGLRLHGAMWSMLSKIKEWFKPAKQDTQQEQEAKMQRILGDNAEERFKKLSRRIEPRGAWRLEFPLTATSFTLSLTIETATPGFCTPNEALLWLTFSVSGISRSWDKTPGKLSRCTTLKVHPHNMYVSLQRCGLVPDPGQKRLKYFRNLLPAVSAKDTDTTITMFTELVEYNSDGWDSLFKSADPSKKVSSANFLQSMEKGVEFTVSAGMAAKLQYMLIPLLTGPFVMMAMALNNDESVWNSLLKNTGRGLVKFVQKLFKKLRKDAADNPEAGTAALNNPENGDRYVDSEQDKDSGSGFGDDEDEDQEDEIYGIHADDFREYRPLMKCNSFCGGKHFWFSNKNNRLEGKLDKFHFKHVPLEPSECAVCDKYDTPCGDQGLIGEGKSMTHGFRCCDVRKCRVAQWIPGPTLPKCEDPDPDKPARKQVPSMLPPCCNTMCGSKGVETAREGLHRFDDWQFLKGGQCAGCLWVEGSCPKDWAQQKKLSSKRLCCLRHECRERPRPNTEDESQGITSEEKVATDATIEVEGSQNALGKRSLDPRRGTKSSTSGSSKIASSKKIYKLHEMCGLDEKKRSRCGAKNWGEKVFSDPNFLQDSQCARCFKQGGLKQFFTHASCSDLKVKMDPTSKDEARPEGLTKAISGSFGKLCCKKFECEEVEPSQGLPKYEKFFGNVMEGLKEAADEHVDSEPYKLHEALEDVKQLLHDTPAHLKPQLKGETGKKLARSLLEQEMCLNSSADATSGVSDWGFNLMWVAYMRGTRHSRFYNATSISSDAQVMSGYHKWWTWSFNVELWNFFDFEFKFPTVDIAPVLALNFDFDLTDSVTSLLDKEMVKAHRARVARCEACAQQKKAFCSRRYIDNKEGANRREGCLLVNERSAKDCTSVVGYDDYGHPTSPRFITNATECGRLKPRKVNKGYRRQYGPSRAILDFRGMLHPADQIDHIGNPLQEINEDEDERQDVGGPGLDQDEI